MPPSKPPIQRHPQSRSFFLPHLLRRVSAAQVRSAIIFCGTCRGCAALALLLEELGLPAAALHSHKSQKVGLLCLFTTGCTILYAFVTLPVACSAIRCRYPRRQVRCYRLISNTLTYKCIDIRCCMYAQARLAALDAFKSEKVPLLLATDVASRGLDIPTVDLVVNYDLPVAARDYVHRVGRTARAVSWKYLFPDWTLCIYNTYICAVRPDGCCEGLHAPSCRCSWCKIALHCPSLRQSMSLRTAWSALDRIRTVPCIARHF